MHATGVKECEYSGQKTVIHQKSEKYLMQAWIFLA